MKFRGSLIAKEIIDDRRREAICKARALKAKRLEEKYKKKKAGGGNEC